MKQSQVFFQISLQSTKTAGQHHIVRNSSTGPWLVTSGKCLSMYSITGSCKYSVHMLSNYLPHENLCTWFLELFCSMSQSTEMWRPQNRRKRWFPCCSWTLHTALASRLGRGGGCFYWNSEYLPSLSSMNSYEYYSANFLRAKWEHRFDRPFLPHLGKANDSRHPRGWTVLAGGTLRLSPAWLI